ncbi:TPA: helix-turn-helix transcriptional regulator [Pseudomonas aeruginosa]|uniref:helix-turn-helix transcriptional regulator n=1 Tax=Pseudomonas aeruginosa TaxID=287 RepID=UPI002359EDCA|nr:AlpA family phage regulatory protein [Pseudomonas aeruginosa]WEO43451.1 AlpA family phage regulatory protein [Pseudomonas aeruginosa]
MQHTDRILSAETVCNTLSVSRVTLWRWCRDGLFPQGRQIGPRRVGWLASEVQAWLDSRSLTGEA